MRKEVESSNFQEQKSYDPLKARINLRYTQIIGSYLTENCVFALETPLFSCCKERKRMITGVDHNGHINAIDVLNAEFLSAFETLRKATISFFMSVCQTALNNSAPTERICMKYI
jgi:hypothetical protein